MEEEEISLVEVRKDNPLEHVVREEPVEGCKINFSSWTISVKRRRSVREKGKVAEKSSLALLGIGSAPNMN